MANLPGKLKYMIPDDDMSVFVEPPLPQCQNIINANRKRIEQYNFTICGLDYTNLRNQIRTEVINKAKKYTENLLGCWNSSPKGTPLANNSPFNTENTPIIATGHAPEFYTPGIWIKNHLVGKLAKNNKGIGLNLVIDNDTPGENLLSIPNLNKESPGIENIRIGGIIKGLAYEEILSSNVLRTDEGCKGADNENIPGKTDSKSRNLYRDLKKKCVSLLNDNSANEHVNEYMDLMIHSAKQTNNLGEQVTFARRQYEERFDIRNLEIPISSISEIEGFKMFFLAIVTEHDRFASIYNLRLENYRKVNRIRSSANPLPNLKVDKELTELPFWIWRTNEKRKKMFARRNRDNQLEILTENSTTNEFAAAGSAFGENLICLGKLSLHDKNQNIETLKAISNDGFKIRPKALTNTLFSRLFLADVFIHGVGGAKYDIITDGIIKDFFGVTPPDYIAISATLFPPFSKFDVNNNDLLPLENELKQMRHNPDKYIPAELLNNNETMELVSEKRALIEGEKKANKAEAKKVFLRMKEINVLLYSKIEMVVDLKEAEIRCLKNKMKYDSIINNRNYPFFIYTEKFIKDFFRDVLRRL
ncbi:MAG: hypothetical protein ACUZ8H_14800 [Candidatus Anammoxibacter sp.]